MAHLQQYFQQVFQQSPAFRESMALKDAGLLELSDPTQFDAEQQFLLTGAVRPSVNGKICLTQGFRHETYVDDDSRSSVPVVMAAASREVLFPLFIEMVHALGETVDVVLESSHDHDSSGHVDFFREQIDTPVLVSALWDFEDLLLNDGCTGIAVLNPNTPQEVQFDEHKLLIIYGEPLMKFESMLGEFGVHQNEDMNFVTEADHVHTSSESFQRQFEQLRTQLGIDADFGSANQYPGDHGGGELNC